MLSTKGFVVDQPSNALMATVGSEKSVGSSTGKFNVPSCVPKKSKSLGTDKTPPAGSNTTLAEATIGVPFSAASFFTSLIVSLSQPLKPSALKIARLRINFFILSPQCLFFIYIIFNKYDF